MKYQLVIQFPEELYDDLDWIAGFEDSLDEVLIDAEVDGHDIGSGEINIFIHTNNPETTFMIAKNTLVNQNVNLEDIKVAYRDITKEKFIVLWPLDFTDFKIN